MASEIRVNKIQNRSGLSTVTFSDTGAIVSGIVTANNFSGNITGAVTGNVTGNLSGDIVGTRTLGTGVTVTAAGVVSATTYYGSGANLTGISADVVDDTSPQLGGDLDTNTKNIKFGDSASHGASGDDTLIFGADDDMRMYHDGSNGFISNNTGAFVIQDSHAGANAIVIRKGAEVEILHNNVLACETSANGLAFPNGKGIDFSATGGPAEGSGSSELFDDYEEGSFTPVWKFDPTNATSVTYNIQNGKYVKIGGVVFIRIELQVSNKGSLPSGAGWAQIDGLPYACSEYSAVSIGIYQHFNNVQPGIAHVGTSEQVYIAYDPSLSSNTSSYDLQHTNFTNNSRINISGTYYAV